MSRKTEDIVIDIGGRDKGKLFRITEMSALDSEEWAIRAFLALGKAGIEVPSDIKEAGVAGFVIMGISTLAKANYDDVKPLLDKMFTCVEIIPDPAKFRHVTRALVENDIEEVATRMFLRTEIYRVHTGFSVPGIQRLFT